MTWRIWKIEEGESQGREERTLSLEEGMVVEQWRIAAEEDHVQRSFTDKGAKHTSGPEKVSKMAAQSVWNVQNSLEKEAGPTSRALSAALGILNI